MPALSRAEPKKPSTRRKGLLQSIHKDNRHDIVFLREDLQIGEFRKLDQVGIGDEIRKQEHDRHTPKLAAQETQRDFPVGTRMGRLDIVKLLDGSPYVPPPFTRRFVRLDNVAERQCPEFAA